MASRKDKGPWRKPPVIAPSILSADFGRLGLQIRAVDKAGAGWIHVDVMDGRFVPNITIGPMVVKAARKATRLPLDVHLMIEEPDRYLEDFIAAGADVITVHAEATTHLHRTIQHIKEAAKKTRPRRKVWAAASLNPSTSLAALDYVLPELDMALVMSVNPGFGGQKFIPGSLEKLRDLKWMIADQGLQVPIQVDGGITVDNIESAAAAGADIFVAGSSVYGADDYAKRIRELKKRAGQGIASRGS